VISDQWGVLSQQWGRRGIMNGSSLLGMVQ
jgi:hypothetical protein